MNLFKQDRDVLKHNETWDVVIIGGGATGLGSAIDAASRGYRTLLLEKSDLAKGTSSRSTKLVHGGVRYLAQGNIRLVYQALRERGILRKNAPHLFSIQEFIIPCYSWLQVLVYLAGLKIYDWLSGKYRLGRSVFLSREEVRKKMPGLRTNGLRGGVLYYDGTFDDARLAVNMAQTVKIHGGEVVTYAKVQGLLKDSQGRVSGVTVADLLTGEVSRVRSRSVVNATGVFVDDILRMDSPDSVKMVRPSQGVHVVLDRDFLNSSSALMIPETPDKRVLFAIPWHGRLLVGTTDTPVEEALDEPVALEREISFILSTAGKYLVRQPKHKDVLSVFAGLRPLAAPKPGDTSKTREISRDHKLIVSDSCLVTITGGKWTTYRKMAEDTVNAAIRTGNLEHRECVTRSLPIYDADTTQGSGLTAMKDFSIENEAWAAKLHPRFPALKADVIRAVRNEMAYRVEDVLARRLRLLFIDAKAAIEAAPAVAQLIAEESGRDGQWIEAELSDFTSIAKNYLINDAHNLKKQEIAE